MIVPKFEDFKNGFHSFKLGTKVHEMSFSFLYSVGNLAPHLQFDKLKSDLLPQQKVITGLNSLRNVVADYVGYNAALSFDHLNGGNKELLQEIEGKRQDFISNLFVTGFIVSGTENQMVKITYKWIAKDNKINGASTQAIDVNQSKFGFEEQLKNTVDDLIKEIYEYIYKGKHSDSDQSELSIWQGKYEEVQEQEETKEE